MKSNITLVIILVSIIFLIYVGLEGIKVGNFEVLSISQLIEKNEKLDTKITEATTLATENYLDNVETLEETYEKYRIKKEKYEQLVGTTNSNNEEIYETKQYDIGYLWRLIGSYATKRKLALGIEVQKNNNKNSSYNINFKVNGKYVNISQFITDIENDSDLYFRIYNFKISGEGENITATFTVRNINLDASTIS